MHDFNEAHRKSVSLPCGHDFCLTCLARLRTSGSSKCPKCLGDGAELEVEALPGMEVVEETAGQQREEEGLKEMKKTENKYDPCKKHVLPYQLWGNKDKGFIGFKCVVEIGGKKIEFINEVLSMIRSNLKLKIVETARKLKLDIDDLDRIEGDFNEELITVRDVKEVVLKHERDILQRFSNMRSIKAGRVNASNIVDEIEGGIEKTGSDSDAPLAVGSTAALGSLAQPLEVPVMEDSEVLLCNIASVYMTRASLTGRSSKAATVHRLLKTAGSSVGPLTEVVRAADELKVGGKWTVDSRNCLAALLALSERQPSDLTLVARPNELEALPATVVQAVAKAAKDCEVRVLFIDSFLKPEDSTRDHDRLEELTKHSCLRITHFYGHLDAASIARLPRTIRRLGLAIGSAADARAVSGLRPWAGLSMLGVSVSYGVDDQDLRLLPNVPFTSLYFPGLTDARVDSVRPAIQALVPGGRFSSLLLPASQLTAGGTRRLARLLTGVAICNEVRIATVCPWRLKAEERKRVEAEFQSAVGCSIIEWDVCSLYGR